MRSSDAGFSFKVESSYQTLLRCVAGLDGYSLCPLTSLS
uniref:Uncharacterized protein n=1 Tax=Anguilla anguilla TaxID=7936 RepID=A0A0E9WC77_ANGAN